VEVLTQRSAANLGFVKKPSMEGSEQWRPHQIANLFADVASPVRRRRQSDASASYASTQSLMTCHSAGLPSAPRR